MSAPDRTGSSPCSSKTTIRVWASLTTVFVSSRQLRIGESLISLSLSLLPALPPSLSISLLTVSLLLSLSLSLSLELFQYTFRLLYLTSSFSPFLLQFRFFLKLSLSLSHMCSLFLSISFFFSSLSSLTIAFPYLYSVILSLCLSPISPTVYLPPPPILYTCLSDYL